MTDRVARFQALTNIAMGEKVVVALIRFDNDQRGKLAALGLRAGSEIRVLQRSSEGPVLVAVDDTRIAVDFEVARKIMTSPLAR